MTIRTDPSPLTTEQHSLTAALLGNIEPAPAELLMDFAAWVREYHDHPTWTGYRTNLATYMGERMGPVLRRLLDLETENARLRNAHPGEPDPELPTVAQEEARARAYLAGVTAGYDIEMHEWTGQDDGTAIYQSSDGSTLVHTPTGPTSFVVSTSNTVQVTREHEHPAAASTTGQCSSQSGPDSPITRVFQDLADRYAEDHDEQPVTVIPGQVVRTVRHNETPARHRGEPARMTS